MNIAFDIHGTFDSHKSIRNIISFLSRQKHTTSENDLFIISGPPYGEIASEIPLPILQAVTIISVVDWLKSKGVKMWQDKEDKWWCEDDIWWESKGLICAEHEIDLIFDDKIEYKKYMPRYTTFVLVTNKEVVPTIRKGLNINFERRQP